MSDLIKKLQSLSEDELKLVINLIDTLSKDKTPAEPKVEEKPKKRRGRPPKKKVEPIKVKEPEIDEDDDDEEGEDEAETGVFQMSTNRKRGRQPVKASRKKRLRENED